MVIHTILQKSDSEGSISSLDLIGVDISQIDINNQRTSIRCRWVKCGQWFPHLEMLATHVTHTHAVAGHNNLFYCGWEGCSRGDRGFNARYKMLVHVRTHTNEKPHHCFQCDKSFSRAENLKIHARSHTGERPYVCPVPGCGKAYSNSSDRFKHTRTHFVDKPYVCKVPGCPKRYTDPSSLRKHVKTYRHFPTVQTTSVNETESPKLMEIDNHNTKIMNSTENYLTSTSPTIENKMIQVKEHYSNNEYLSTPGSQPFPAWPGFLQPWYDHSLISWNTWQAHHRYHVMDMYNIHNQTRAITPPMEEEQDRPLDLTVQAK
ncbi:uncharacterized protein LOC142327750 [Lycorma delicatula]|uniref:uncharacterized protein LOC142327750 n=1 Tax=Lycorma delicatula TaxID=130591 RepID=UPI003F51725F